MTQVTEFFNPNHDRRGRFSRVGGGRHSGEAPRTFAPKFEKSDGLKAVQKILMTAAEIRRSLAPDERIALEDYTKTFQGSHAINEALRGNARTMWDTGKLFTSEHQAQTTLHSVQAIERIFDKTPLNLAPLQLMRGIGSVGKAWGKVGSLNGEILSSDSLNSTTMEAPYAAYAAKTTAKLAGAKPGKSVLMLMYAPEGTVRALPVSDVLHGARKDVRPNPGHEVILPPGTRVKVHSDELNTDRAPGTAGETFERIIRVEVLPEDPNYRQNLSIRDNLSAAISLFYNPNHDAKGRFAPKATGHAVGSHIKMVPKDEIARRLEAIRARKLAYANGPIGKLRDAHRTVQFTEAEKTAMKFYEGSFDRSRVLNDIFRKGDYGKLPESLAGVSRETLFTHAAALKIALSKSPALSEPAVLYRTIRNLPDAWQGHASFEGATIKDPGFMSTTSIKSAADYYLNHVERAPRGGPKPAPPAQLILNAPAGTKALPLDLHVEGAATEELVLPPGTSFRVTKDTVNERGLREIHGDIVPISELADVTEFFNPSHDGKGRFARGGSAVKAVDDHFRIQRLEYDEQEAVRFYEGHFGRAGAMNDLLRHNEINAMNLDSLRSQGIRPAKVREHVNALKRAFDKAPPLTEPVTVERIIRNVPKAWVREKPGLAAAQKEMRAALDESNRLMIAGLDFQVEVDKVQSARKKVLALLKPDVVDMTGTVIKDPGFMSTSRNPGKLDMYAESAQKVERGAVSAKLVLTVPAGTPVLPVDDIIGKPDSAINELLLPPGRTFRVMADTVDDKGLRVIHGEIDPYVPGGEQQSLFHGVTESRSHFLPH